MRDTTQKTNQRMPGRSAEVIGKDLAHVRAAPPKKPDGATPPAPVKKPVIKLNPKVQPPRH